MSRGSILQDAEGPQLLPWAAGAECMQDLSGVLRIVEEQALGDQIKEVSKQAC